MAFVKPNAIINDPRVQDEKDEELKTRTGENLFHIQKQLVAHGHSLEAVIAAAAKSAFGVSLQIHKPAPKGEKVAA